jgi:hypothetical protein
MHGTLFYLQVRKFQLPFFSFYSSMCWLLVVIVLVFVIVIAIMFVIVFVLVFVLLTNRNAIFSKEGGK